MGEECAGPRPGARSRAHADAVVAPAERRVYQRHTVVTDRGGLRRTECRSRTRRPALDFVFVPQSAGPPSPRASAFDRQLPGALTGSRSARLPALVWRPHIDGALEPDGRSEGVCTSGWSELVAGARTAGR